MVSHTTVHKAFRGPQLPSWGITEMIVEELAKGASNSPEVVVENFRLLWTKAADRSERAIPVGRDRGADKAVTHSRTSASARPLSQILLHALDEIEQVGMRKGGVFTIPTGLSDLDVLTGGFRPGSLNVIASGPSIGKSTLALDICRATSLRHHLPSAFFSSEMSENEIQMRLLSAEARVSLHWLRSGYLQDEDWSRLGHKLEDIAKAPLWLLYAPALTLTLLDEEIRNLRGAPGVKLVAVDSLQGLAAASCDEGVAATTSDVLRHLKRIAHEFQVPIVVTARIRNEDALKHRRPEISDMQDSEAVYEEADTIIMLYRPDAYDREHPRAGEVDLIVAKQRNGPTATATAAFQGHYMRIVDMSGEDQNWSIERE